MQTTMLLWFIITFCLLAIRQVAGFGLMDVPASNGAMPTFPAADAGAPFHREESAISAATAVTARLETLRTPSSVISGTSLLLSASQNDDNALPFSTKDFSKDKVVRVVDGNTIKLEKLGQVSLASVKMPTLGGGGNFQFPECFNNSPTYKIRQLLPKDTAVLVKVVGGGSNSNSNSNKAILIRNDDKLIVNQELVRQGYARVKNNGSTDPYMPDLEALQQQAKDAGLGIYKQCDAGADASMSVAPIAEFEPLQYTVETRWSSDGGTQVLKARPDDANAAVPKNPGDRKGCSDFDNYEEALQWFEYYRPFYGDVARLDRDGDGVPCPRLPHTTNRERYRMKIPSSPMTGGGEDQ